MGELSKHSIIYLPDAEPEGAVQIIHDMADHQGRYRHMAQMFADHGIVCVTTDIKGHGNNISRTADLGFFGDNAVARIIGDIHDNTVYIKEKFSKVPYALIGQGMGALIAAVYFKKYDNFVNALFLSGMPSYRTMNRAANIFLFILIGLHGEYQRSRLVQKLLMKKYSAKYENEGSEYAWLTLDQENTVRYQEDPKCAFTYTLNGYRTLTELMHQTYQGYSWIRKNRNCPVRILYGSDDTCMLGQKGLDRTVNLFKEKGYTNVSYSIIPDQRHELFQDTDRDNVIYGIINILENSETLFGNSEAAEKSSSEIAVEDFIDVQEEQLPVEEERINLEDFIISHSKGKKKPAEVELIDFIQPDDNKTDDLRKFLMDPNNLDGIDEN